MTGEVGWAIIAHKVKVAHQPLHASIRVNREFSSNCGACKTDEKYRIEWFRKGSSDIN